MAFSGDTGRIDETTLAKAGQAAITDLESNVFKAILTPLSDNDRLFLQAMAGIGETVRTKELQESLGAHGPAIQPYRKRLIEAGIIEAPRRGELTFAVPYLAQYLRDDPFDFLD